MKKILLVTICCLAALTACTIDTYEKGDGEYSNVQGDFALLHANSAKMIDYVELDDGERLNLKEPMAKQWVNKADTFYRSVLFYKKNGDLIEVVSAVQVSEMNILSADTLKKRKIEVKTDPLKLESVWVSKNKQYMNASIYLKTGSTTDETAIHLLGLVADSLYRNADNSIVLCLRLLHDQGGMPEYYSVNTYFSLPLRSLPVDSIRLTVNTYEGEVTKSLSIR